MNEFISNKVKTIDFSGIRKILELAQNMKNPVNLSIGEPDFSISDVIKNACCDAIHGDLNAYTPTQGIPALIQAIKDDLAQTRGAEPDDVFISSGVSGGLFLTFNALLNAGDEVIVPDPYFAFYKHALNLTGAKPVFLDTYPEFTIDAVKLEALITPKTKAILINSPGNPTGKIISQEEIDAIVVIAKKHNIFIISDEIYDGFNFNESGLTPSPFGQYEKVILLNGFSKTLSATGWRIGYVAGPKEILQAMKVLQQFTFICAPSIAQQAVLKGYQIGFREELKHHVCSYHEKNELLYQGLKDKFDFVKPEGAFYAFIPAPGGNATKFVEKAIANELLIVPGSAFSEYDTHFRVSFSSDIDTLNKGIEILNRIA